MTRIVIDAAAQDGTPAAGHNLGLASRVKTLEDLARSYANGDLVPGVIYAIGFDVPDHASQAIDNVLPCALTVIDAMLVKTTLAAGANANTVQVQTAAGAANVTDAMSINGKNVGDIVRPASLLTANASFAAGATLRVNQVKAGGDASFRLVLDVMLN